MQSSATLQNAIIEDFYNSHNSWLYAWLCKKLGSSFDAADLAQDTLIKVAYQGNLTELHEPRAYLTTTATRLIIDLIRKRNIEKAYLEAVSLTQEFHFIASPEQIKEAVDILNEIATMLEGLPEKVYRAFLMCRLEGMPYAEIAADLNVSASMVKQYIARAMAHCYHIVYPDDFANMLDAGASK